MSADAILIAACLLAVAGSLVLVARAIERVREKVAGVEYELLSARQQARAYEHLPRALDNAQALYGGDLRP